MPNYIHEADAGNAQSGFAGGELAKEYLHNPLAADVRYWGHWVLERARDELAALYPPDPDGGVPVAYLWSRTIPCPSCRAEMPLIRQYWLARKEKKKVALEPVIDEREGHVDFRVVEGPEVTGSPERATTSRGDTRCLVCGQVVKAAQVKEAGAAGKMSAAMTSVVVTKDGIAGKAYREDVPEDQAAFAASVDQLSTMLADHEGDLPLTPDEPIARDPRNTWCHQYGLDTFDKLFNERQLLALTTFARLVREAHADMQGRGLDEGYAEAIATYLALAVDRLADRLSTLCRWDNGYEKIANTFTRQALPMVWDYSEGNPFSTSTGDFRSAVGWILKVIRHCSIASGTSHLMATATKRPAASIGLKRAAEIILSDPPYYDSINYANLSDFFYAWLKRSVGFLHPDLLSLPLTPKREQTVMNVYANGAGHGRSRKEEAREHYVSGMAQAFDAMSQSLDLDGLTGIVFAHTDPDAWSTLIEGLLEAGLVPDASWPIDTELQNKAAGLGQARLKTSVWMACRRRKDETDDAFLGDVLEEMRPVIRERLLSFWSQGIRGADFFISAIGPALSVFGRHRRVLRPDGTEVSVRDFLDIVRRESTVVALEQVLHGADLGVVDPITRHYVTWVWSYSRASLDAGEALALCLATGASFPDLTREHSIAVAARERSKKIVKLRTVAERAREDDDLGMGTSARPAPLIDELQRAAWLWGQNQSARLGEYRGALGESRWTALLTLGQAVAECLPDGDEDRRIILGLLGATVRGVEPPEPPEPSPQMAFSMEDGDGSD